MSADALRHYTIDKVNLAINEHVHALLTNHELDLPTVRLIVGKIAGLKDAIELMSDAHKGMEG